MLKKLLSTLSAIILFVVLCFLAVSIVTWEYRIDEKVWNNGTCYCGGTYEFVNASSRKSSGSYYYYHCDDCGNVIRTYQPQIKN